MEHREMYLRLEKRMLLLGVTRYGLAQLTGISESTLLRYFAQQTSPTLENTMKIAKALNMRVNLIDMEQTEKL